MQVLVIALLAVTGGFFVGAGTCSRLPGAGNLVVIGGVLCTLSGILLGHML